MGALDRIAQFIYPPAQGNESDDKRLNRAILVVMASATSMGGIVWGTVYWALGVPEVSIWPYGYVVLSFVNLMIYLRTKKYEVLFIGQLSLILIIPTGLQWDIGGFAASGAVILWSFLSPIVALIVSEHRKDARFWFVAFFTLALISGIFDSSFAKHDVGMPDFGVVAFFVMNVFAPLITTYFIVFYFIGEGRRAQAALQQQSQELEDANVALQQLTESLEEKVRIATTDLREALGHLSAIINNLVDGLLVTDLEGKITHYNPTLVNMFGLEDKDLLNKDVNSLFSYEMTYIINNARVNHNEAFVKEVNLPKERTGNAASTAIMITEGDELSSAIGTVTLIRDITREKEIDRMKTDFISTVSHELRTPLTSVLGFARIIQKRFQEVLVPAIGDNEDRKIQRAVTQVVSNVDIIVSEGERLTALINDVLDIAKMEAGKFEWKMENITLVDVVNRATAATTALFENKHEVNFVKEIDESIGFVFADSDRMMQVLVNLISNAAKFTDKGHVTCRVKQQDGHVIVSVEDTGIGIPEEDIENIFDKFIQVGNTLTDKPKGTGLGLPICKQIIEYHQGRIWAESTPGEGTTVLFTIPLAIDKRSTDEIHQKVLDDLVKQLRKKVGPGEVKGKSKKRILVVDDETNIRALLRQVLEAEDYEVLEAKDGVEAINEVKKTAPDLIILDVMMPNVNGFDVTAILKSDPDTMGIPIIILSIIQDRDRGTRLGVDRYLNKPIDSKQLLQEIGDVLEEGSHPRTVLVMDEDASVTRTISDVLAAKGYSVVEASNNDELFKKAIDSRPDMIVLTSVSEEQSHIVKTLRFERGLEHIYIVEYK